MFFSDNSDSGFFSGGSPTKASRLSNESFGGSSSSRTAANSPLPEFTSHKDGSSGMVARKPIAETAGSSWFGGTAATADFSVASNRPGTDNSVNRRTLFSNPIQNDITNFYSF